MSTSIPICVFAKPPVAGRVNTRLAPRVGDEGAARLAHAFLLDTIDLVNGLPWAHLVLATTGPLPDSIPRPAGAVEWPQGDGDLGERVERVLRRALEDAPFAIALGVDSPGLPAAYLEQAREALGAHDAVLGPCEDGGFYTISLRWCPDGLLEALPWSRSRTMASTHQRLCAFGLTTHFLPTWFDVDRPVDLDRLRVEVARGHAHAPHTMATLDELTRA